MNTKIIRGLMISLLRAGQPMPEDALIEATQLACRPDQPTRDDVIDRMKTLASEGYLTGATDELTRERFWELTSIKGVIRARQLR